jgi:hypothetical protein
MRRIFLVPALMALSFTAAQAHDAAAAQDTPKQIAQQSDVPTLEITWPADGAVIELGDDLEKAIGVVVKSNFTLVPEGECGDNELCGHIHMKIDPAGDSCNIPGREYNSMNSDFGGNLIQARFGHCPSAAGTHVIGILLADQYHTPILLDGKPVTALVTVTTK